MYTTRFRKRFIIAFSFYELNKRDLIKLLSPFVDVDEMKNQEIDRYHNDHYQYRCQQFTRPYPKEEVQQTDFKQVINQMAKTKADRIMRGWLGTKSEESSQKVVTDKSHCITCRKGDVGIRNQQDQAIYAIMNGRRYCADNSKTDELPELIPPVRMLVEYSLTYSDHRTTLLPRYRAGDVLLLYRFYQYTVRQLL